MTGVNGTTTESRCGPARLVAEGGEGGPPPPMTRLRPTLDRKVPMTITVTVDAEAVRRLNAKFTAIGAALAPVAEEFRRHQEHLARLFADLPVSPLGAVYQSRRTPR